MTACHIAIIILNGCVRREERKRERRLAGKVLLRKGKVLLRKWGEGVKQNHKA